MKTKDFPGLMDSVNSWNSETRKSSNSSSGTLADGFNFYYIYLHPIVLLLFVVWQIVLIRLLRGEGFWSKYAMLFAFTITEIVGLSIEASSFVAFYLIFPSAIPGHLCQSYYALSTAVPIFMSTMSQWLKIGYILFVFLLITKPFRVKTLIGRRNICIYVLLSLIISLLVTVPLTYSESTHRVYSIVKENLTSQYCHHKNFVKRPFLPEGQSYFTQIFMIVSQCLRWLIPLPLFLVLTIRTALAIRKSIATRRKMVVDQTRALETLKLAKATVLVAIFYAIVTLVAIPSNSWDIARRFSIASEEYRVFTAVMTVASTLLHICNVPFTFLMFTLLSPRFKQSFKCACKE